jgi:hypothetical protein
MYPPVIQFGTTDAASTDSTSYSLKHSGGHLRYADNRGMRWSA